ncbi:MAG: ATP-binding cassette domain-containing protein [Steroidobacteraceae bacterium]
MLNFNDVALRRGPRLLIEHASFSLFRGEKVGITGENGSGKSTLLALVRGELQPDAGSFERPPNLVLAHVAQDLEPSPQPAIEFVLDGDARLRAVERELAALQAHGEDGVRLAALHGRYAEVGGYDARSRAAQLMHGLGFDPADDERPIAGFSGGWRVRINVARALMCPSDVLLLDEPTNHLDLDAILWLEQWLRAYPGTLLLIAHDREFLDRVCDRIVNLEHGRARAYRGNYSAFETQRAAELAEQGALFARQQREIRHMEAFVERFRAKASKARQAQSRLKALERMQRIAPAHVDSSAFEFGFGEPEKLPRPLLVLEDESAGYDGRALLEHVSLTLAPGDRLALLGRNGAGKSTCMKLLAGELAPLAGTRTAARDLAVGYFAQHHLEQLAATASPLDNLLRVGGARALRLDDQQRRDYLARFGFRGERVFEPVGVFSGGEKARLVLALVSFLRPNLLLLDEPTNHLDLEMRQALAVALQDYAGAVVLVSHDRHLLNSVADRFCVVHHGRVEPFDGDLEDYALAGRRRRDGGARGAGGPGPGVAAARGRRAWWRGAERRGAPPAAARAGRGARAPGAVARGGGAQRAPARGTRPRACRHRGGARRPAGLCRGGARAPRRAAGAPGGAGARGRRHRGRVAAGARAARCRGGGGGRMKTLLIVCHSRTGGTLQMASAAAEAATTAAGAAGGEPLEARLLAAAAAGPEDVLAADGYLFATPENLAAMAGVMKDFFDRCYYPALERIAGRPYAALVCAGTDGSGAARQLERIVTGWRLRAIAPPLVVHTHADTPAAILAPKHIGAADLARCAELGATLGAGLALGVY